MIRFLYTAKIFPACVIVCVYCAVENVKHIRVSCKNKKTVKSTKAVEKGSSSYSGSLRTAFKTSCYLHVFKHSFSVLICKTNND